MLDRLFPPFFLLFFSSSLLYDDNKNNPLLLSRLSYVWVPPFPVDYHYQSNNLFFFNLLNYNRHSFSSKQVLSKILSVSAMSYWTIIESTYSF
jgi:hypothetical protein